VASLWHACLVDITYAPGPDGAPDPGEVARARVTYEDDPTPDRHRPVLRTGRDLVVAATRPYLPVPT
jgi:hypothetical protein